MKETAKRRKTTSKEINRVAGVLKYLNDKKKAKGTTDQLECAEKKIV